MLPLTRQGTHVGSVFSLLGTRGNDLAATLGFTLSQSPLMAAAIAKRAARSAGMTIKVDSQLSVALDVRGEDETETLLEIRWGTAVFTVEANAGWRLPSAAQLASDADRIAAIGGHGVVVSVSQAPHDLAQQQLPAEVSGVPLTHLGWADIATELDRVKAEVRGLRERLWLEQFQAYLTEVMRVRRVEDSWTYCVVLTNDKPGGTATYREIVAEQRRWFHPYGIGNWPMDPPNFLAFRWEGAVRRIHRVIGYDVLTDLRELWPEMSGVTTSGPHAVYQLGPRLPPLDPIAAGEIHRSQRLWVLLDQLQSAPTLAQAYARSKELSKLSEKELRGP